MARREIDCLLLVSTDPAHPVPLTLTAVLGQGTGTSGALPSIACLTSPEKGCKCCRSTLDPTDPLGRKNVRRNTSAILRIRGQGEGEGEGEKTILIDASALILQVMNYPC
jgi:hypothetical protein